MSSRETALAHSRVRVVGERRWMFYRSTRFPTGEWLVKTAEPQRSGVWTVHGEQSGEVPASVTSCRDTAKVAGHTVEASTHRKEAVGMPAFSLAVVLASRAAFTPCVSLAIGFMLASQTGGQFSACWDGVVWREHLEASVTLS